MTEIHFAVVKLQSTFLIKISDEELDVATQAMYDYIVENKKKNEGKLIIYGYSWGGVLAGHLARRLEASEIKVDQIFLVDAAASRSSKYINREIPDNADDAHVYWTNNKEDNTLVELAKLGVADSEGAPGKRKAGSTAKEVDNVQLTFKWGGNGTKKRKININHSNIDDESWAQIVKLINDFLNQKQ